MQITADVTLKGPVWAEMLDLLVGEYIPTNMDLYALSNMTIDVTNKKSRLFLDGLIPYREI